MSAPQRHPNDIEIGWLIVGRLDAPDRAAAHRARKQMLELLTEHFPRFEWRMPAIERADMPTPMREEPVELLQLGLDERDARHWDYVLVLTGADLIAHRQSFALATPSRALGVGVLSTARIDPQAQGVECSEQERSGTMADRLTGLALHVFGRLAGLERGEGVMAAIESIDDLDVARDFSADDQDELTGEMRNVADLRVEETLERPGRLRFYLRASWLNREPIAEAVARARPWKFPFRLSRLTTAALSTLLILINTAEVWEVAMSQSPAFIAGLSLTILLVTTWYVVRRQRLLVRRSRRRLTEQSVVTNVSLTLIVVLGMLTTYVGIFVLTGVLGVLVFPDDVVTGWTGAVGSIGAEHYALLSGFIASLGITIGALGASFEQEHYFRHIAYVDEEV